VAQNHFTDLIGIRITRRWGQPPTLKLMGFIGWQLCAAGVFLLILALTLGGSIPPLEGRNLGALAYLGLLGAGLTFAVWIRGLQRLPASRIAILGLLSPVTALTLDVLVLHKTLSSVQVLGVVLIVGGIALEQGYTSRRASVPPKAARATPHSPLRK